MGTLKKFYNICLWTSLSIGNPNLLRILEPKTLGSPISIYGIYGITHRYIVFLGKTYSEIYFFLAVVYR